MKAFFSYLSNIFCAIFGLFCGSSISDDDDDPFTIIFISDLETIYRYHSIDRSQYVVDYILKLKEEDLYYDDEYGDTKIEPRLVVHGGDINHMWSCDNFEWWFLGGCRNPDDEFRDVWGAVYRDGIPMLSGFGNHDWAVVGGVNPWKRRRQQNDTTRRVRDDDGDDERTDLVVNTFSSDFVRKSYERSAALGVKYEEFPPSGQYGQSMYRATFRGFQIASFNCAVNWQSYDDNDNNNKGVYTYTADEQFQGLSDALNRTMKTMFFSHYPLNGLVGGQTPTMSDAIELITEFDGAHHFSGHFHVEGVYDYDNAANTATFRDYVAPYPHSWKGNEPGFYSILVSRTSGILQVKTINIPGIEAGELCIPLSYLDYRQYFLGFDLFDASRRKKIEFEELKRKHDLTELNVQFDRSGLDLNVQLCCDKCKAGNHRWESTKLWFVCDRDGD